jgi:hypothetical protein
MSTGIKITDVRFTFIWIETNLDYLDSTDYPDYVLGERYSYIEQVKKIRDPHNKSSILEFPWEKGTLNFFWQRYLGGHYPGQITADKAWEKLIPLRKKLPITITPQWIATKCVCQAFYYPFGVASVVTITLQGDLSLDQLLDQAFMIYENGTYTFLQQGASKTLGLKKLGSESLDVARQTELGSSVQSKSSIIFGPLSLVTVVKGENVDAATQLILNPQSEKIQRALEGLSNWQPNWSTLALPPLNTIQVDRSDTESSPGDVIYSSRGSLKFGRVIWFPGRFTLTTKTRKLSCYHNNQMIAMVHTESLGSFAKQVLDNYPKGSYLSNPKLRFHTNNACIILDDLYNGIDTTYRSGSVKSQIEKRGYKEVIDKLRKKE